MLSYARFLRTALALLPLYLLAVLTASAQEAKLPALGQAITGVAGSPGIKPIVYKAPEVTTPTEKLPAVFDKKTPESVDDLKAIQNHVAKLVEKVSPAVVSVRVGASSGSGVIVTKDGYILTAGHVSGTPDRDVTIYFHNGKTAKGKTLGGNHGIDSGMIKITTDHDDWPCVDMGDSAAMKNGNWCMVIAHPGGFKPGRTPPVRLGRVLNTSSSTLTTDCILVGGDSGGPLFDMHGRVVGINSRIGDPLTANMHVTVNPFRDGWDKIARSEVWGGKLGGGLAKGGPYLGVQNMQKDDGCHITVVTPGSPAEKAGLKANDIIVKFDGKQVTAAAPLPTLINAKKAGDTIVLEIRRGEETLSLKVEIGKRP